MHRKLWTSLMSGATALALVAAVPTGANAQAAFNFNTTGYFTSGAASCLDAPPGSITVVCEDPDAASTLALTFTGRNYSVTDPFGFVSGSTVTLGDFVTSGNGSIALDNDDLLFTLVINQTMPSSGSNSTQGSITGSLQRPVAGASFSDLIWTPTELVNIDAVTYDLIFRAGAPGIVISASTATTIEAVGTVTPEPVSMALLGTGLFGVAGAARRRRRKNELEA